MEVIPYGRHLIEEDDVAEIARAVREPYLTQGPAVERFERAVADRCHARHAVACNSGTAALHLSLLAAEVGAGDEIVVPAITFLATANCGIHAGGVPRFTDVDFDSVLMTAETLEPHLSEHVRVVLPVHFAGVACDMEAIRSSVRSASPGAVIIEDACHALGGNHGDGTPVGSLKWADMVAFSFHPVKHIAVGEGGMVLTDDDRLAERLRRFRNHGMTKAVDQLDRPEEGPWYYEMHEVGYNYRIADLNCALGLSQLNKLDRFIQRRREIAARYFDALDGLPHVGLPACRDVQRSAWHIYSLHVDFEALGKSRRQVMEQLTARGVGTQVHYYPVPLQPYYRKRFDHAPGDFAGAEKHYARALTVPLHPSMTDRDVDRVIESVRVVIG